MMKKLWRLKCRTFLTSALDMPEIMSYIYIARAGILIQISIVTTDTISKSEIVNAQAMYSNTIGNEM